MEPFQVFISSVMRRDVEDLAEERIAAREAVDSFSPIACAWAFESEPASSKPLRDSYIDEVKTCDLLLLLIGRVLTPATREEYETACDCQKPILVFCKNVATREPETAQLLESIDAKYATFDTPTDLREAVRVAIAEEIRRRLKGETAVGVHLDDCLAKLRALARNHSLVRVAPLIPVLGNYSVRAPTH